MEGWGQARAGSLASNVVYLPEFAEELPYLWPPAKPRVLSLDMWNSENSQVISWPMPWPPGVTQAASFWGLFISSPLCTQAALVSLPQTMSPCSVALESSRARVVPTCLFEPVFFPCSSCTDECLCVHICIKGYKYWLNILIICEAGGGLCKLLDSDI